MNAAKQRRIALVFVAIFVIGMLFLITHRKAPPAIGSIEPPTISSLVVKTADAGHPLNAGDPIHPGEALDFEVEVKTPCWAYVYSVQAEKAKLEYAAVKRDPPWQPGVYAPEWAAPKLGIEFERPGPVSLYVVTSPMPVEDPYRWSTETLKDPYAHCPLCGVASAHFDVQPR